jgi:tRNA-2-methylthio-N6-dimethylallyladenosine synthase
MNSKSFFVKSYGCQMNVYDSEKIASILENKGMIEKEEIKNADVVIFNTCNIKNKTKQNLLEVLN